MRMPKRKDGKDGSESSPSSSSDDASKKSLSVKGSFALNADTSIKGKVETPAIRGKLEGPSGPKIDAAGSKDVAVKGNVNLNVNANIGKRKIALFLFVNVLFRKKTKEIVCQTRWNHQNGSYMFVVFRQIFIFPPTCMISRQDLPGLTYYCYSTSARNVDCMCAAIVAVEE